MPFENPPKIGRMQTGNKKYDGMHMKIEDKYKINGKDAEHLSNMH